MSVDQRIAAHVGEETPQSSIVLACEQPMTGYHESNFSMASWRRPDSPVPVEVGIPRAMEQKTRLSFAKR
jgi:hypothetical protein